MQNSICQESQNQEKYLCLNKECYIQKKKQLHCHECLVKLHQKDRNNIRHLQDFITIDTILNSLQTRNTKKLELFDKYISDAHAYKKQKFQDLCQIKTFSCKSSEFQNQIFQRIETIVEQSSNQLNQQISQLRTGNQFQKDKLNLLIEQYLSNDNSFNEQLNDLFNSMKNNVETYISQIELSDPQNIKQKNLQQLKKKIEKLQENQKSTNNTFLYIGYVCQFMLITYLVYILHKLNDRVDLLQNNLSIISITLEGQSKLISDLTIIINRIENNRTSEELQKIQEQIVSQEIKITYKIAQLSQKQEQEFIKLNNLTISSLQIPQFDKSNIIPSSYIRDRLFQQQGLQFTKVELLYRSSRDGLYKSVFWKAVQNKGSTLLVALLEKEVVVGAVTIPSWVPMRAGDYIGDPSEKSFLYSYSKDEIYKLKEQQFTIYSRNTIGPQYGYGPDLSFQGYNDKFDEALSNLGVSYEAPENAEKWKYMLSGSRNIIELEVFQIS